MSSALRPFRDKLADLYLVKRLKLEDIRERMKSEHSIDAGRSTYERLFKEWGLKKNKKVEDWSWVSHRIQKRRKSGRQSRLFINDKRVPAEVLQKEVSRHVSTLEQALQRAETAPSPQTPDGYTILTPPCHEAAMTPDQTTTFIDLSHTLATHLVSLADDSGTTDVGFVGHGVGVEPVDGGESTAHVQSKEELILQGLESCTLALSSLQCTFRLFDTRLILLEHQLVILGIL